MPSVSIAMATFDGARHLRRQLASLAEQSALPLELVVNDDGSNDATVALLEDFASSAPFPVRLAVNATRLGWRANFMAAVSRCQGDLIAFCDQDDDWYAAKLETLLPCFDDPEVLLAFHDADLIDDAGRRYATLWPVGQTSGRIARLSRPTSWSNPLGLTQIFRRSLLRYNDLWSDSIDHYAPPHRAAHDQWFYFLATNLGDVVGVPDRVLGYRQHGGNTVGWQASGAARPLRDELARSIGMLVSFATILRKAASRDADADSRGRLLTAAAQNERLLDRLRMRLSLHQAPGFIARLQCTAALLQRRAYDQKGDWGLGRRALVVDATVGLFSRQRG